MTMLRYARDEFKVGEVCQRLAQGDWGIFEVPEVAEVYPR
jgi:hypothetical protein